MTLTPLQNTVSRLDKSLSSGDKEVCRLVIDNARPCIAIRQGNKVTVCLCCGNSMVYSGNERLVKCCECGRNVEIIEEDTWLSSKRTVQRYFATVDVVEGIQLMRTYDVVLRYSAINRLKDVAVNELCRHWITSDGRCEVTSKRRFMGTFITMFKSMKLRLKSTDVEDYLANHATVLPEIRLLPELSRKLVSSNRLIPGNALATIRNLLEPDYSTI